MKNISKLFGIIVFVAVIGFSMISCDRCPKSPDGKHKYEVGMLTGNT